MYEGGDYDLAGFAVGVVERERLLPRGDIGVGDVLLGVPSDGLHSNGFSLVRKVVGLLGLSYDSPCPWAEDGEGGEGEGGKKKTLGEALLKPTKVYVKSLGPALRSGLVKGLSHITGGGFIENIPRVLPSNSGIGCTVDVSRWKLPPVFEFLMRESGGERKLRIEPREMCRTFNCGVGMVVIVAKEDVGRVKELLREGGEKEVYEIGEVKSGEGVELLGLESWEV